jgi:NAD(P)-dependent dehydrogenase (short-subunit alcohol dehydrogenase family)
MGRFDGRIAVVSGGASGIGRATALRLASEGARIEILDRQEAAETCCAIADAGGVGTGTRCDVTDDDQIADAVEAIGQRQGRVDILVNNAGILIDRRPWHTRSRQELESFLQVNYVGLYALTRAVYPLLQRSACGRIVMMASRTALVGNAEMAGYVESKAAVMALTKVLARELGPEGITVNAVAPGMIDTPGTRVHSDGAMFERARALQILRQRVTPEHVAAVVAFLASDDAAVITGQTIVCDGGGFLH